MPKISPKRSFEDELGTIQGEVAALDTSRNADLIARYELAAAGKALRAFVAGGDTSLLSAASERLRRVLTMVPRSERRLLGPRVERLLASAKALSESERQSLAHDWAGGSGGRTPLSEVDSTDPGTAPEKFHDEIELAREALRRLPAGMERWTWEESGGKQPVRWPIDREAHVQSLLWLVLAPVLPGLKYEETLPSIGRTHPRVDLALPSSKLAIEVKFIRRARDFARVREEIAADANFYTSSEGGPYSRLIVFVWDDTRSSEQHAGLVDGLMTFRGVTDAIVISRPGRMERGQGDT